MLAGHTARKLDTALRSSASSTKDGAAYQALRGLLSIASVVPAPTQVVMRHLQAYSDSGLSWQGLVDEAEYQGVTSLIAALLVSTSEVVPADLRRLFAAVANRSGRACDVREICIEELLQAFASANLPVLLLKGAALAHLIYPLPSMRPSRDIDVLIRPADEAESVKLVTALGYSFAAGHGSRFAHRMHHLPIATKIHSGFPIALELHRWAMSPDHFANLTIASLAEPTRVVQRGTGTPGLALGPVEMLHHLSRHTFEPASRPRLIHLYDLWLYGKRFGDTIDWLAIRRSHPQIIVVQQLVGLFFDPEAHRLISQSSGGPTMGEGMLPLSQIAASDFSWAAKLGKVLNPPAWWLHAFYGVPWHRSLLTCRLVTHPATLARWLGRRLAAYVSLAFG